MNVVFIVQYFSGNNMILLLMLKCSFYVSLITLKYKYSGNTNCYFSIMEGEESLSRFSPEIVAKKSSAEAIALLPQIVLLHGTEDYSIPSSARFCYLTF